MSQDAIALLEATAAFPTATVDEVIAHIEAARLVLWAKDSPELLQQKMSRIRRAGKVAADRLGTGSIPGIAAALNAADEQARSMKREWKAERAARISRRPKPEDLLARSEQEIERRERGGS